MKAEMARRLINGNKDFIDVIKRGYELEALAKPQGRPKKEEEKKQNRPLLFIRPIFSNPASLNYPEFSVYLFTCKATDQGSYSLMKVIWGGL